MNKKVIWSVIVLIIIIIALIATGKHKASDQPNIQGTNVSTRSVAYYDQKTREETTALFADNSVTFTTPKLGTMTLSEMPAGPGARYSNPDESIVFWTEGNVLFITKDSKIVFNGSTGKPAVAPQGKLPAGSPAPGDSKAILGTWVWQKTVMRDAPVISSKKAGVFTVTFGADGKITGKTDCNGFFGSYKLATDGIMSIGEIGSTKMFCEGSQEATFTGELAKVNRYSWDASGNLLLNIDNDAGSMVLLKK